MLCARRGDDVTVDNMIDEIYLNVKHLGPAFIRSTGPHTLAKIESCRAVHIKESSPRSFDRILLSLQAADNSTNAARADNHGDAQRLTIYPRNWIPVPAFRLRTEKFVVLVPGVCNGQRRDNCHYERWPRNVSCRSLTPQPFVSRYGRTAGPLVSLSGRF